MIKNFVFLGVPGVGKGTIASKIANEKGIIHISTGNIFRAHIKNKSLMGMKVKQLLSSGKYVPDEIVNPIVKKRLQKNDVKKNGFILDGYPRTINQAEFLKSIIDERKIKIIFLQSKKGVILERLAKRLKWENRNDDSKIIIDKRFSIYEEKTTPLIDYYQKNKQLIIINAEGTIEKNIRNFYRKCFNDND